MMLNPNCSEYITRIELTEEDITQFIVIFKYIVVIDYVFSKY